MAKILSGAEYSLSARSFVSLSNLTCLLRYVNTYTYYAGYLSDFFLIYLIYYPITSIIKTRRIRAHNGRQTDRQTDRQEA